MSANNYILIEEKKNKKRQYYRVTMRDAETGYAYGTDERVPDLRSAIEVANKIQEDETVEYGIQVNLLDEQALREGVKGDGKL